MLKRKWILLTTFLLVSGCATGTSNLVTPKIQPYASDVQALAAKELGGLGPSCPRTHIEIGCSAIRTMMDDYGNLRAQIRKIQ